MSMRFNWSLLCCIMHPTSNSWATYSTFVGSILGESRMLLLQKASSIHAIYKLTTHLCVCQQTQKVAMEKKAFGCIFTTVTMVALLLLGQSIPIEAQGGSGSGSGSTSLCTNSMLRSFTPCMNYLTGSTSGSPGSGSPTADCCASLKLLMGNGLDCLCEIVMGGVPFRIPYRNLAMSLPKACNQPGVPIECKASPAAPLPAPGPAVLAPFASPAEADSPSPLGMIPVDVTPTLAPMSDSTSDINPSTTVGSVPPASSATVLSFSHLPSLFLSLAAIFVILIR